MDALSKNVRHLRALHRISTNELARRAGIGRATLVSIEAGRANPTLETINALADVLGTNAADLLRERKQAAIALTRRDDIEDDASPLRLRFFRRFHQVPCVLDLASFEMAPDDGFRQDSGLRGALVHMIVHHGELTLRTEDDGWTVQTGDYFCYRADAPAELSSGPDGCAGSLILHYAAETAPDLPLADLGLRRFSWTNDTSSNRAD